ncbi:hypothetical protein GSY69_07195 [Brevibacterium sp. 5221]|uniref:OsmC family peroxiredoxin n=1 Tax=Brevibacterium rongguiense TaxID=2695267 RepID=A0A6N9H721_9MICO|nr:OsmC family protein [Brevibacterium rongguiense]MYM19759.1 hypothetical protein [Brevibacterium rongguiense]
MDDTQPATGADPVQPDGPRAQQRSAGGEPGALSSVTVTRTGPGRLRAQAPGGAAVEFGTADGLLSPAELLLAALAGCMAATVEEPLSRAGEPELLELTARARHQSGADGENTLADLGLEARLRLAAGPGGEARTAERARRVLDLAHERYCTVSRTLHHGADAQLSSHIDVSGTGPGAHGEAGAP